MTVRSHDMLVGVLMLPTVLCIMIGISAFYWPNTGFAGTFGRMFDSLAPQMLGAGLMLSLVLLGIGRRAWVRGLAIALISMALAGGGVLAARHMAISIPLGKNLTPKFNVLWFNIYANNSTPPDELADAILNSGADVVVLGEAEPILPALDRLLEAYPHRLGCTDTVCSTLVLSKLAFVPQSAEMITTTRPGRMAAFEVLLPNGRSVSLLAVHMPKPWYYGFYDIDLWYLINRSQRATGPLVVVGDFNAAPWSRSMARIFNETGLSPPRTPSATWPAAASVFGVPIDQILFRDTTTPTELRPWGAGLGSNHRGFFASVAIGTP